MELTSNDLYFLIKKKIMEKKKNLKPVLPSISITKRFEILKRIKKEENIEKYFIGVILNESNISNLLYNSVNPQINNCFKNLEYLSITNNYLINLDFILNIPDLIYLDVYGNPLDDCNALNYKNIFGYLRLSVDKFHENKILAINGLYCSILDIEIKDKTIMKLFIKNNPNIILFNNEINYYIDKFSKSKMKTFKPKKTLKYNKMPKNDIDEKENNDGQVNNALKFKKFLQLNFENQYEDSQNYSDRSELYNYEDNYEDNYEMNDNYSQKYSNIHIEIKNSFLLEIKQFFEELNFVLTKISRKIRIKITSNILSNDTHYINIEKKRILLLYKTYLKISEFNNQKKSDYFFCKNLNSINCNKFTDTIKIYEMKKYIKCININIRFGLILLITMLFYCINLISMKLTVSIIHYILLKYYKYDEHKQFPNINSFGNFHYLCYYLDNLEDFKQKLKFAEKSQIDLYQKILDILEVKSLILKSNFLKEKKDENERKLNNKTMGEDNTQKNKVSSLLLFMKELKVDKFILVLIEFFCDFIIYENMEQVVINGSFNDEYSTIIEIKEILEQIELDKNNLKIKDLSFKKYYKNKLERIFNKFYFENNKIKVVKNKNFKNFEINKISTNSSKFNLLSFIYNWNRDYMKTDEINIKNCFSIDKLIKNRSDKNKNLISFFKDKDFTQNIYFSEEKKIKEKNGRQTNSQTIVSQKNPNKTQKFNKNTSNKIENLKINYKTNYNNSNFTINPELKNNSIGIKSSINIMKNKDYNLDNNYNNIIGNKSNTCKELFKYFEKSNRYNPNKIRIKNIYNKKFIKNQLLNNKIENIKNLKQFINDKEIINKNNFNTLGEKECCYPFNSINQEDAKLKIKIKRIDTEIAHINAHRLYCKKKYYNSRENIQIKKENISDGFSIEKYNQAKQESIIRKIIEDKNRIIKEKINEKKSLNK